MTTTSFSMIRHTIAFLFLTALLILILLNSCQRGETQINQKHKPSYYSSEVLDKWMSMQLRLMRNATGIANHAFSRHFAYAGVAAFESLKPGLPAQAFYWSDKWNGLTGLPVFNHAKKYYYPANVNAALAAINKAFFPNASAADKIAIDSLEAALKQEFLEGQPESIITTSSNFGRAVAAAIFNWAETDGYKNANNPYTMPTGTGLWKPTAPAFANPATPYWGNNRAIIDGSINNSQPGGLFEYSTDPASSFYYMVKEVYDASLILTDAQKAMAMFWRDIPGVSSPGHWLSILQQVIKQTETNLEKAALAYALTGTGINDALIACFKAKYQHKLVRPITYIREVMGYVTWNPFLGTPAHPEYSSAHSSLSMAAARIMEKLFGNIGSFTDHTYDYLGFAPRTYSSLTAIGVEAGRSRFYAGIHYNPGIEAGIFQGNKVAENILNKIGTQILK
ncbi:MAG TPA: vanadium-dependent haloperoxidase [Chitinophagaceae bacterium]|nr:vanadium-dependent haloperoxidase [Chitinophagaceae bacterium]